MTMSGRRMRRDDKRVDDDNDEMTVRVTDAVWWGAMTFRILTFS